MGKYSERILADGPSLYWKLDETSGTTIHDSSGHDRHGKIHTNQVVGASGVTRGQPGGASGGDKALKINGNWSSLETQDMPGTGVRADNYKPYQPGANLTMECMCYKIDPLSFATMFAGNGYGGGGANSPHPTLEWGEFSGVQMARWYSNVNTFPIGWVDWGTNNAYGTTRNEFKMNTWQHIMFTVNDDEGLVELWINGRSQGRLGPLGFGGVPLKFPTVVGAGGDFQIGWRGDAPQFPNPGNTEVWGGLLQHVTVYERILSEREIVRHWWDSTTDTLRAAIRDKDNPARSIELALSRYFAG